MKSEPQVTKWKQYLDQRPQVAAKMASAMAFFSGLDEDTSVRTTSKRKKENHYVFQTQVLSCTTFGQFQHWMKPKNPAIKSIGNGTDRDHDTSLSLKTIPGPKITGLQPANGTRFNMLIFSTDAHIWKYLFQMRWIFTKHHNQIHTPATLLYPWCTRGAWIFRTGTW